MFLTEFTVSAHIEAVLRVRFCAQSHARFSFVMPHKGDFIPQKTCICDCISLTVLRKAVLQAFSSSLRLEVSNFGQFLGSKTNSIPRLRPNYKSRKSRTKKQETHKPFERFFEQQTKRLVVRRKTLSVLRFLFTYLRNRLSHDRLVRGCLRSTLVDVHCNSLVEFVLYYNHCD